MEKAMSGRAGRAGGRNDALGGTAKGRGSASDTWEITPGWHPRRPAALINMLGESPFCYFLPPASGDMITS